MEDTAEYGGARFHFDPRRTEVPLPCREDIERWMRDLMRNRSKAIGLGGAFDECRRLRAERTAWDAIADRIPVIAKRRIRRLEDESIAILRPHAERMRDLMREYMVDLLIHPISPLIELAGAIVLRDHAIDELHRELGETPRPRSCVTPVHDLAGEKIHRALENEALNNLMRNPVVPGRGEMMVASLKAAREEVGDPESIRTIDSILEAVEAQNRNH